MLLHAGQGHPKRFSEFRDRGLCVAEPLKDAASGSIRESGEGGVEVKCQTLNHMVQCLRRGMVFRNRELGGKKMPLRLRRRPLLLPVRTESSGCFCYEWLFKGLLALPVPD